jgi:hypothetical protein
MFQRKASFQHGIDRTCHYVITSEKAKSARGTIFVKTSFTMELLLTIHPLASFSFLSSAAEGGRKRHLTLPSHYQTKFLCHPIDWPVSRLSHCKEGRKREKSEENIVYIHTTLAST